ncbi:MAG TPA: porin [Blastocatellia bacterium]|nr:porin [Blastocatellia bacterium]
MRTTRNYRQTFRRCEYDSNLGLNNFSSGARLGSVVVLLAAGICILFPGVNVNGQSRPIASQRALASIDTGKAITGKSSADEKSGRDREDVTFRSTVDSSALLEEIRQMRQDIERLHAHVAELETHINRLEAERQGRGVSDTFASDRNDAGDLASFNVAAKQPVDTSGSGPGSSIADASVPSAVEGELTTTQEKSAAKDDSAVLAFFRDTTINVTVDGYYAYNFNHPIGRVNLLRAYDVSHNSFSLNQAAVVIEQAPNVEAGRRFGLRLDLQYGQATETLQGSANNELRPQAYRPVWQAYGTYIAPIGKGLSIDFGKFASNLGYESNYTKDNYNYSRAFYFNFLPFYHFGLRTKLPINDKVTVMYNLMNGVQESEDFNRFKSQHFAVTLTPVKKVTWQVNYYVGREQRDVVPILNPTFPTLPTQPGLPTEGISPAPKGRFHIVDTYAAFNITDNFLFALEGDYVIHRVEEFSAPSRVTGGAAYARYQFTPKFALAARGEYLSDRGGLFSGVTQALKETTLTADFKVADGLILRGEWRRDFSNQEFFLTDTQGIRKREQNTATIGMIWWIGKKQGSW